MFRSELGVCRRVLRAGIAVLLVGGTVAVLEVPASVHADPATIAIANGDELTTPSTLATTLLAPGETLSGAVTINGSSEFEVEDPRLRSYGTFSNGLTDVGLDSGLIIAANADASSFATGQHVDHVSADRPDLALGNLLETQPGLCNGGGASCIHNATDLSFSLIPSDNFIKFDYSLIITERGDYFPPWEGEMFGYPDGFALFVNGETPADNCAAVPASGAYLTMSTAGIVPPEGNAAANRAAALATVAPNQQFAYAAENPEWTVQFLSVPLTCVVDVSTQNIDHTPVSIRIVVADVNDGLIPPAVLIKAGSVRFEPTASPIWQDFTLGDFQVDTAYFDGVHASGGPVPTYSVTDGLLPVGISLDETTGEIIGTPTEGGAAYDFTITVTNAIAPDLVAHFTGNIEVPPTWTDNEITDGFQVGLAVDDGVVASGTPSPTYSISAGDLPVGLTLDPGTGAITGTPTTGGDYSFTITAGNGVGSAVTQDFSGTVTASPTWIDQELGPIQFNVAYVDGVSAFGTPRPEYSVTDGLLPVGISFDETTGEMIGTPTEGGAAYEFTITVTNGIDPDLVAEFTGAVAVPPVWTDDEIAAPFQVGLVVDDGVAASGTPAPTYSITAGELPLGLTLDAGTGAITGTPTVAGDYSFTVSADNAFGSAVTQDFSGTVTASPTWIDQTLGPIQFDVAYVDGVGAFGTPDPTYSISAGLLPVGISLDETTGEITGTPTAAGASYDFTITVTNGVLPDLVAHFTGAVAVPPAWTDSTIAAPFQVGLAVDDGVAASGTPAPTYAVSSGTIPIGLSLHGTTGAITGTPTVAGEYDFTISAVNGFLPDLAAQFTGTVVEAPTPIVEPPTGGFLALNPTRLLDTRDGDALDAGVVRHLSIAGLTGIPADATWVVLNLTATNAATAGFITVYSCDATMPPTSNVNFLADQTVASSVSVALDDSGGVCIFSNAQADVIVDISGAYSPSEGTGRLATVEPYRITDTREGGSKLTAGTSHAVNVAGHGMPDDATAVLLNITVDGPTSAGFVTAYPCGSEVPVTSNLNFVAGQTIANSAVVRIGSNRTVCFYVSSDTDLIVDVNGSYSATASGGYPTDVQQQRLLDTRITGSAAAGSVQELDLDNVSGVPPNATSVTLNVTVDRPQEAGFVTVYPCSSERPLASHVNFVAGQTVANSVTVPVGLTRTVCVFTTAATDLIIDLNGVYSTLA